MKKSEIVKYALLNSLGVAVYVAIVVVFMFSMENIGPQAGNSIFIPIFMLMLLVFSVALVGTVIFGRPVMWYIDGKKPDALRLLAYTLGIFFLVMFLVFIGYVVLFLF